MTLLRVAGLAAGLGLLGWIVTCIDYAVLADGFAAAGWGVLVIAVWHLLPLSCDAMSWRVLLDREDRPGTGFTILLRWVCQSINGLLPAAQVGGDIWRFRALVRHGMPVRVAAGSIAADLAVAVFSQILFTFAGLWLLYRLAGRTDNSNLLAATIACLIGAGLVIFLIRKHGSGLIRDMIARFDPQGHAAASYSCFTSCLADPRKFAAALGWRMAGWLTGTGEVWLAFWLLGAPVDIWTAVAIEAVIQAVRSAGFIIPGALGLQEGGMIAVAALFAIDPATALAAALLKRCRELLIFLPGLGLLAFMERNRQGEKDCGSPASF